MSSSAHARPHRFVSCFTSSNLNTSSILRRSISSGPIRRGAVVREIESAGSILTPAVDAFNVLNRVNDSSYVGAMRRRV